MASRIACSTILMMIDGVKVALFPREAQELSLGIMSTLVKYYDVNSVLKESNRITNEFRKSIIYEQ